MKVSAHTVTCQSHKNVRAFHFGTLFLYFINLLSKDSKNVDEISINVLRIETYCLDYLPCHFARLSIFRVPFVFRMFQTNGNKRILGKQKSRYNGFSECYEH